MITICGIDCGECSFRKSCRGCEETCGKPFGGTCVAAEYIKAGGKEAYAEFKRALLTEINSLLTALELPTSKGLFELAGRFVNLEYEIPSGKSVKLLDDSKVYLGCQIEMDGLERCIGVVADTTFVLICSYGENGSEPELIQYRKR